MTIANSFTLFRLFVGPLFLYFYASSHNTYALIALITVAELTDAFDGYFARKYNQVSDLGKILDPMADSIYRLSIFLAFSLPPVSLPLWIIFIFLYRDIIISTLRTLCALKGFALAARTSGKIKAVWQAAASYAILFLMIPFTEGYLSQANLSMYSTWIAASAAFYSVFSGVDYILAHKQQLHRFCHK